MIAIAIIGILALVLIPKVAGLKNTARESGLDTNVRIAVSVAEAMIDQNTADGAGCLKIEADIATKLAANGGKNPITKATSCLEATEDPALADGNRAFTYVEAADAAAEAGAEVLTATSATLAGVVKYDAYVTGGKLYVTFMPYDASGVALTGRVATTN